MKNSGRIRFVVAIEIGSSILAGKVDDGFGTRSLKRNKKGCVDFEMGRELR